MPPGKLLVFEGLDGAGKTTQARLLAERLRALGHAVVQSREPTDGPWGRKLRASAVTGRLSPEEELAAFIEDRRAHVADLILPSLRVGKVVILDRYYFSTAAYQGARGLDPQQILRDNEAFAPPPDLLLILEVPPGAGVARVGVRGAADEFEREEDLRRVAVGFSSLDRPYLRRVDGTLAPEVVAARIFGLVAGVLPSLGS